MSYNEPHRFEWVKIDDGFSTEEDSRFSSLPRGTRYGPVFLPFLEADFSSYAGFRSFVESYGLEGFIRFDPDKDSSLKKALDAARRQDTAIPGKLVRLFHESIKDDLIYEQRRMQRLFDWYLSMMKNSEKWETWIRKNPRARQGAVLENIIEQNPQAVPIFLRDDIEQGYPLLWEDIDRINATHIDNIRFAFNEGELAFKLKYLTILARCYHEIFQMIIDQKVPMRCEHCKLWFFPKRGDETYCNRFLPGTRIRTPLGDLSLEGHFAWTDKRWRKFTCKGKGPQEAFRKSLEEDEERKKFRKNSKKWTDHLRYLKNMGQKEEYKNLKKEFKKWKEKNRPRR